MIYVFLADGFEETEAIAPIDILRRSGCEVVTVGVTGAEVTGSHKVRIRADITGSEFKKDKADMIVLPGGGLGTVNLEKSAVVQSAVDYCAEHNIPIGAICAAPSILGKKGLLRGKKATSFPDFQKFLEGAEISEEPAVIDGNIITAVGAGAAIEFGLKLSEVMCGAEKSGQVRAAMQCAK